MAEELVDPRADLGLLLAAQGGVGAEPVVAELPDAGRGGAGEHVGHVRGAEAAAQLADGAEDLGGHAGGVAALHGLTETDVARLTALALVRLTEVRHQRAVTADGILAERVHLAELSERAGRGLGALG